MIYYQFVLFFLLFCLAADTNQKATATRNVLIYISFLLLMLLRTFENIDFLPDLAYYKRLFDDCRTAGNLLHLYTYGYAQLEYGYVLLTKFCGFFSPSFHFELFVIGIIIVTLYYKTISKYSDYFWLSLLVYFITIYPTSTYILRQYLSMSLLFASIYFVVERKLVYFIILMIIAWSLHQSSIVWIPLYFIYGIKNKKTLALLLFSFAVIIVAYSYIFVGMLEVMESFEKYQQYIDDKVTTSYYGVAVNFIYLVLYVLIVKEKVFEDGINRLLLINVSLSLVISLVSVNGIGLMFRLIVYFTQMQILLLPRLVSYTKGRANKIILTVFLLIINILPNYMVERTFHLHQLYYAGDTLLLLVLISSVLVVSTFLRRTKKEYTFK